MHYHAEIHIEHNDTIEKQIAAIMAPYQEDLAVVRKVEEDGDVYWNNPQGFWDWFQIRLRSHR